MQDYENLRQNFRPAQVKWLLVAESGPPKPTQTSTRHFYRMEAREGDRLFTNTIKAIYPETMELKEPELEKDKLKWLQRLQTDGFYMIEAVPYSIPHGVKTPIRRQKIRESLPDLIQRLRELVEGDTRIILIKSNTFIEAAGLLKEAGFKVINDEFLDFPGYWREQQYREKLAEMLKQNGWKG